MIEKYTLTGATDWPILIATVKLFAWMIGGLLGVIALLIAAMWHDIRTQFTTYKAEAERRCAACKEAIGKRFDKVWAAIDDLR